jgi:PAS domain S-box-containing protein
VEPAVSGSSWEQLFWLLFERSDNPVILLSDTRVVVGANDAALELFGQERTQILGRSIEDSIEPHERAAATRDWSEFLRSGHYEGTRRLLRPDGGTVQIEFAARRGELEGRSVAMYVAMVPTHPSILRAADLEAGLRLTAREREVVTLIALGRGTREIAKQLFVSESTVRTHVRNAMAKLDVHTRAQLVAVVLSTGQGLHPAHLGG